MLNENLGTTDSVLPKRKTTYLGPLTDTNRWDDFGVREDDIFICTPPKCGTTWTQAICAFLILDTLQLNGNLLHISPWFDSKLLSLEDCLRILEGQTHRRFIKTHTPLDGIPYFDHSVYLMVYRDPKDAYFSIRNHLLNMVDIPNPDMPQLAADPRDGFRAWLQAPFEPGIGEQRSLEAFTHHFQSYWQHRHLDNFHFLHYADMKKNPRANIRRIADILRIEVSDERLQHVCKATSFTEMKKNASFFAPAFATASDKSLFRHDELFFHSGKNEQWRDVLLADDIEQYHLRIRELLAASELEWVEYGSR